MAEFGSVYKGILTEGRDGIMQDANHSSQPSLWVSGHTGITICDGLCRYWSRGGNVTVWLQPQIQTNTGPLDTAAGCGWELPWCRWQRWLPVRCPSSTSHWPSVASVHCSQCSQSTITGNNTWAGRPLRYGCHTFIHAISNK